MLFTQLSGVPINSRNFNLSARMSDDDDDNDDLNLGYDFSIPRIRFKPGYSRQWRKFRSDFLTLFHLKFKYQTPLTKYISKLRRASITTQMFFLDMQLSRLIHNAHLFWFYNDACAAIKRGLVYVNG